MEVFKEVLQEVASHYVVWLLSAVIGALAVAFGKFKKWRFAELLTYGLVVFVALLVLFETLNIPDRFVSPDIKIRRFIDDLGLESRRISKDPDLVYSIKYDKVYLLFSYLRKSNEIRICSAFTLGGVHRKIYQGWTKKQKQNLIATLNLEGAKSGFEWWPSPPLTLSLGKYHPYDPSMTIFEFSSYMFEFLTQFHAVSRLIQLEMEEFSTFKAEFPNAESDKICPKRPEKWIRRGSLAI